MENERVRKEIEAPGLCLYMKEGDRACIGQDIVIEVYRVLPNQAARVRIAAPKELRIDRLTLTGDGEYRSTRKEPKP
jgi:hypothetical protein